MRIQRRSGSDERKILTALITNQIVCARIANKWEPGLFQSTWSETVAKWCVDFYNTYNKAPKADIECLFESWAADGADKDTVALVEKFLCSLDEDHDAVSDAINVDYITDLAADHFNRIKLKRLTEAVSGDIDNGKLAQAVKKVSSYGRVEMGEGSACDVLQDKQALLESLTMSSEPLIVYPGALGPFFQDALVRDALVSIQAPEKRGKTFWLVDIAWRAMLQKRKVAFFAVGDMSRNQMLKRILVRACRRPLRAKKIKIPISIMRESGEKRAFVDHDVKVYKEALSEKEILHKIALIKKKKLKTNEPLFRLSCHPNSSISAKGVNNILQQWEREGWTADVVVIDYADILAMPDGGSEQRDQINDTWKRLRAMSQERHCLVVTATQADAASYTTEVMDMTNFSEDKRKFAHVTGMFGLNQTPREKELGVYRLNWLALRESEFDTSKVVHVAGCLDSASPAIKSCF